MADTITILSPGLLSTIQDTGRTGWMHSGFAPSGAMDLPALYAANLLVGNTKDMPAVEMTLQGPEIDWGCDAVIALTGADFAARLNGDPVPAYRALRVLAGDILRCGSAVTGCRGYLAVAGGFDLEPALGSCSTNLKCGLGGFAGRKLRAGDKLPLRCPEIPVSRLAERVLPMPDDLAGEIRTLRVVLGPQDAYFTENGLRTLLSGCYAVTLDADRMGVKLHGAAIESRAGSDILSDGIAAGSVQVPAAGQPIVMLADRQTIGGYAKIATVITADLPLLAQARPGDRVRFARVSVEEAQKIARRAARETVRLEYRFMHI